MPRDQRFTSRERILSSFRAPLLSNYSIALANYWNALTADSPPSFCHSSRPIASRSHARQFPPDTRFRPPRPSPRRGTTIPYAATRTKVAAPRDISSGVGAACHLGAAAPLRAAPRRESDNIAHSQIALSGGSNNIRGDTPCIRYAVPPWCRGCMTQHP